jgi:hypothetical protein
METSFPKEIVLGISEKDEEIFSGIIFAVTIVLPPVLIVLGLFGNILSYLVLRQPQHAKQTTCYYMRMLAIFDSLILVVKVSLRTAINYQPAYMNSFERGPYVCPAIAFSNCTFGFSNWTIAAMTFDRFIAVRFPLKAASWSTMKKCKVTVAVIFIFSFVLTIPYSIRGINPAASVQKQICMVPPMLPSWWHKTISLIHSSCLFTIPFFKILILNVLIIFTLFEHRIRSAKLQVTTKGGTKKEGHITVLLFIVTLIFFVTNVPWTFDQWIWDFLMANPTDWLMRVRKVVYEIEVMLLFVNPSVNFYIYCLACQKFREDVKTLMCSCKKS